MRRTGSEALCKSYAAALDAARGVTALVGGTGPGAWKFAGRKITDEAAEPLLILVDELNTVAAEDPRRVIPPGVPLGSVA